MTKLDFFKILFKVLGLALVFFTLYFITTSLIFLTVDKVDYLLIFIAIVILTCLFFLIYILLYQNNFIINFLKLDQGYDDDFIKIESISQIILLKTSVFIIGSYLIIANVNGFLYQLIQLFKSRTGQNELVEKANPINITSMDYFNFITSALGLLAGYLIITNYSTCARWILKQDKENTK